MLLSLFLFSLCGSSLALPAPMDHSQNYSRDSLSTPLASINVRRNQRGNHDNNSPQMDLASNDFRSSFEPSMNPYMEAQTVRLSGSRANSRASDHSLDAWSHYSHPPPQTLHEYSQMKYGRAPDFDYQHNQFQNSYQTPFVPYSDGSSSSFTQSNLYPTVQQPLPYEDGSLESMLYGTKHSNPPSSAYNGSPSLTTEDSLHGHSLQIPHWAPPFHHTSHQNEAFGQYQEEEEQEEKKDTLEELAQREMLKQAELLSYQHLDNEILIWDSKHSYERTLLAEVVNRYRGFLQKNAKLVLQRKLTQYKEACMYSSNPSIVEDVLMVMFPSRNGMLFPLWMRELKSNESDELVFRIMEATEIGEEIVRNRLLNSQLSARKAKKLFLGNDEYLKNFFMTSKIFDKAMKKTQETHTPTVAVNKKKWTRAVQYRWQVGLEPKNWFKVVRMVMTHFHLPSGEAAQEMLSKKSVYPGFGQMLFEAESEGAKRDLLEQLRSAQ
jgi:hypothetical protein